MIRTRAHIEDDHHAAVFEWADYTWFDHHELGHRKFRDYLSSMPNGGDRHVVTGAIMERTGARMGCPDMLLDIAVRPYSGA